MSNVDMVIVENMDILVEEAERRLREARQELRDLLKRDGIPVDRLISAVADKCLGIDSSRELVSRLRALQREMLTGE